jgi:hypothetical protein
MGAAMAGGAEPGGRGWPPPGALYAGCTIASEGCPMTVASQQKQRRPPPSHRTANADLRREVVRVWRQCGRNTREAARNLGMSEGGVRHYLDQAREEWKATAGASFGDAADEAEALIRDVYETASERYHQVLRTGSVPERASAYQYLGICLRCIADLRQLRGLDAPASNAAAAPQESFFVETRTAAGRTASRSRQRTPRRCSWRSSKGPDPVAAARAFRTA